MSIYRPTQAEIHAVAQSRGQLSDAPGLWRGLVGAWPMQEGGGTLARDVSGFGGHGTLTNMEPWTDWVMTKKGRALDFDGQDDCVEHPNSKFHTVDWTQLSMSCWIAIKADFGQAPIGFGYAGTNGANLRYRYVPDTWSWFVKTTELQSTGIFPADSVLHHIAGTFENSTMWLYTDGALNNSGAGPASSGTTSYKFWIGRNYLGTSFYPVIVLAPLIHSRAVSSSEIAQLYADPWAMYRLRARVFPAVAAAPPVGNRRRRMILFGSPV